MAHPKSIVTQIRQTTLLVLFTFTICVMFIGQRSSDKLANAQQISPDGQTITFWHPYTDARQAALETIVNDFNASNEWGIRVETTSFQNTGLLYDQMILQLIEAANPDLGNNRGGLPNIVIGFPHEIALYSLTEDTIVDLNLYSNDPLWGFSEADMADFGSSIINIGFDPFQQAQLGWPTHLFAEVMVVNMDAMHELGYDDPPTSYADFIDMTCVFREQGGWSQGKFGAAQGFLLPLEAEFLFGMNIANGGILFEASPTPSFTLNSPSFQTTLSMLTELQQENCIGVVQSSVDAIEAFAAGQTLFYFGSTSTLDILRDNIALNYATPFDWGVFPLPGEKPQQVYVSAPIMSVVNHSPEANLAAWLFLKWFLSSDAQSAWIEATGSFPIRHSSVETPQNHFAIFPQWQQAKVLITDQDTITTLPALASYDVVRLEIQFALQRILAGTNTPEAEWLALDMVVNEILTEFATTTLN